MAKAETDKDDNDLADTGNDGKRFFVLGCVFSVSEFDTTPDWNESENVDEHYKEKEYNLDNDEQIMEFVYFMLPFVIHQNLRIVACILTTPEDNLVA